VTNTTGNETNKGIKVYMKFD